MHCVVLIFASLLVSTQIGESARILGIIPTPSFSHQVAFRPIWNELARRGHDVVVITTDPQNNPDLNLTEIDVSFTYPLIKNAVKRVQDNRHNVFAMNRIINEIMNNVCYQELLHPEVQALLRNESEHFDLVMVEYLMPILFGIAERFKAPYIGVVSVDLPSVFQSILGNPSNPVAYPDSIFLGYVGELNFWERLGSVGLTALGKLMEVYQGHTRDPFVRKVMEEQFGDDVPPLETIMKNVSLVLINENPAFYTRPLGPGFVLFGGGTHLMPLKPLPQDLKEYLDGAKDGFIYFSLGTNVKSDVFLPDKRKIVLDAFRELPYKVLWKFDVTDIPDVPDNVKIATWLPQQDILRHPNIKVFITQGGLQSTEEATFSHVPIVGIPYIADQVGNVRKVVAKGGGIFLDKETFTKESLKEAVLEVIKNPKYKESITEIAELSRDQPMTGIEKAVWWTEYVIRHKGARHFRNPAMDLPAYQYYFLDVIGFVLAVLSVVLFIIYKLIVFIKNLVVRKFFTSTKKIKSQ